MKYRIIILIFVFVSSCKTVTIIDDEKIFFSSSGFAYIYNDEDYRLKKISKKFKNHEFMVAHSTLKPGTILKISNPENKKSIVLKNSKRIKHPTFYKILLTEAVANKIELNKDIPFVEIQEVKKNDSFIADKAKTFNEEKKIHSKAPVTNIMIDNISKFKKIKKVKKKKFSILIAEFYSRDSALNLKNKLMEEIDSLDNNKLSIKKKNINSYQLISGRYNTVNLLKNDYIKLKNYGFENLDINLHE